MFRKGIDIFSKSRTLLIKNSLSADLCQKAFFLENRFFFWYVCLLMIVSIDTIMCGKQIVLFFGQESVVVVETSKILLLFIYLFIYFYY